MTEPRPFTHVCLDCGALGFAGGYHDHGGGEAGDTAALVDLPGSTIRALRRKAAILKASRIVRADRTGLLSRRADQHAFDDSQIDPEGQEA